MRKYQMVKVGHLYGITVTEKKWWGKTRMAYINLYGMREMSLEHYQDINSHCLRELSYVQEVFDILMGIENPEVVK